MPRWVLYCRQCHAEMIFSEVQQIDSLMHDAFLAEIKPAFPDGGVTMVCPNCKAPSVHQRHELIYQPSGTDR